MTFNSWQHSQNEKCSANARYVSTWVTKESLEIKIKSPLHANNMQPAKTVQVKLNPFTSTSDQDRISPYNINTISSRISIMGLLVDPIPNSLNIIRIVWQIVRRIAN